MAMRTEMNKNFVATSAVGAARLVQLSTASGTGVEHNTAGNAAYCGITLHAAAQGEAVAVQLRGPWSTAVGTAAKALAAGAALYAAADGKLTDASAGTAVGTCLSAATAADQEVEFLPDNGTGTSGVGVGALANQDAEGYVAPIAHRQTITNASGAAQDTTITKPATDRKFYVLDAWFYARDTAAANVKLVRGGTDITDAVAKGTANNARKAFGTFDAAQQTILTTDTLKCNLSANGSIELIVLFAPVS